MFHISKILRGIRSKTWPKTLRRSAWRSGLKKISLLGHSCGGVLAQAYALQHPGNLSRLILCSTFHSTAKMNLVFPYLYRNRPDPNFDPGAMGNQAWDVYREMWGSHGEFIIAGNLGPIGR